MLISSHRIPGRMLQCICVNQNIIEEAQRNCHPIPEKREGFSYGEVSGENYSYFFLKKKSPAAALDLASDDLVLLWAEHQQPEGHLDF